MFQDLRDKHVLEHVQLCLDRHQHAVRTAASRVVTCHVTALALMKLRIPDSKVGPARVVPPSLSCLLPVALGLQVLADFAP